MTDVNTITGTIDSADLGRALSHEHLTNGMGGMERVPGLYDEADALEANVEALKRVKAAGIETIIDLTPLDLGRQVSLFQKVAARSDEHGANVVCATGVYRWVPPYFFRKEPDEIAEYFISEIEDGIEGTDVKAGIIKLAWDMEYRLDEGIMTPRDMLEATARAAARTAKATGVPISCHTRAVDELGIPLLDIFEDEGLDLAAVTIGHSNDTTDLDYLLGLAKRGANVGFDRYFSRAGEEEMIRRAQLAKAMVDNGFAAQTSLGHDATPYGCWGGRVPPNPDAWLAVPTFEVPWLLNEGVSADDVAAMQAGSIRNTFEAAAALKG
jgi:phosphotriesterase-related protein